MEDRCQFEGRNEDSLNSLIPDCKTFNKRNEFVSLSQIHDRIMPSEIQPTAPKPTSNIGGQEKRRSNSRSTTYWQQLLQSSYGEQLLQSRFVSDDEKLLVELRGRYCLPWKEIQARFNSAKRTKMNQPALQMRLRRLKGRINNLDLDKNADHEKYDDSDNNSSSFKNLNSSSESESRQDVLDGWSKNQRPVENLNYLPSVNQVLGNSVEDVQYPLPIYQTYHNSIGYVNYFPLVNQPDQVEDKYYECEMNKATRGEQPQRKPDESQQQQYYHRWLFNNNMGP